MSNLVPDVQVQQTSGEHPELTIAKVWEVLHQEVREWHPRLWLAQTLLAPLPFHVGSRLRTAALRLAGFSIGHGTLMWAMPTIVGNGDIYSRLKVGRLCRFNIGCFLELGAEIVIEDLVGFGPQVMILTTTHEIGPPGRRSSTPRRLPVRIGKGCWIGARSTILPGVTIGAGSIVAAGALVNKDVPANSVVAGVPARVIKSLD